MFYPIFTNAEGTQIIRVGTSLPAGTDLSTIQHLENEKVVFPINTKGEEVIWHLTQDSLMDAYSKGYVRLSGFNAKRRCEHFLSIFRNAKKRSKMERYQLPDAMKMELLIF